MRAVQATFVFTDIEGSTRLWLESPDSALDVLELHDQLVVGAFEACGGTVKKNTGDGLLAVFPSPREAVAGVLAAQKMLVDNASALGVAAHVRMAIHQGSANARNGDLFGLDIHVCQRIMSLASGRQVLVSETTARALVENLPRSLRLVDLGRRRLKGITDPLEVYSLVSPGLLESPQELIRPETGNLPEDADSFIGREDELAVLARLMDGSRVITLTGEGGVGKSRLALEFARRIGAGFADGAWLVPLDQVGDDEAIPRVVADGIGATGGSESIASLVQHLADREALLVLDGCELGLAGVSRTISEVIRQTHGVKVIATSRERVGVAGETLYRVGPLPLPDAGVGPTEALGYDAVTLFAARAAAANDSFRLTKQNVRDVVTVCRKADGLPIAIEVAAARVSSMTPREIAERLTAVAGRSPVEGVISWSLELLVPEERDVFRKASVFRSPFDAEAAEAVICRAGVFDDLVTLVEKSLLRRGVDGRFLALAPIREFAARLLDEAGEAGTVADRHAQHFALRADALGEGGPSVSESIDALAAIADDLRAAQDHSLAVGDEALALRIAIGMAPLWKQRGPASEGLGRLESALGLGGPAALIAAAHMNAGDLAVDVGAFDRAEEHLGVVLDGTSQSAPSRDRAWALARLASIPHKRGHMSEALARFQAAERAARDAGDDLILAHVLASLSLLHSDRGDLDHASAIAEQAVEAAVTSGDPYAMADVLLTVGELELDRGDTVTARIRFREAMMLAETVGMRDVAAWALSYLGRAALIAGDPREAAVFASEGRDAFERGGSPLGKPWAARHLALARWQLGHTLEAIAVLDAALADARRFVKPEAVMLAEAKAWIRASSEPASSARELGATEALAEAMGLVFRDWERANRDAALSSIEASIGSGALRAGLESGRGLLLEDL